MHHLTVVVPRLVALGLAFSLALTQPACADPLDATRLTQSLAQQFAASTFPGACMAVAHDDRIVYRQSFGFADVASQRPYTAQTVQPVGSVSKTVIGLALMKAVELGHFGLDTNVRDLIDFPVANPHHPRAPITVRQLATHTSSIVDRPAAYEASYEFGRSRPSVPLHDYLKSYLVPGGRHYSRGNFARERPGAAFHYSNIGASLAAYLIEARSGVSFAEFSERHALRPLQMDDSGWFARADQADRTATLYTPTRGRHPPYTSITYPDGSLRTTCDDLGRYLTALMRAARGAATPPLAPAGFAELFRPQFDAARPPLQLPRNEPNQGLFFAMRADGGIGHTGSDYGVSAFVFFDPATQLGRIFMTNVDVQEDPALQKAFAAMWRTLGEWRPP